MKIDRKTALKILETAKWKSVIKNNHVYIEAVYNGFEVSIRDDSGNLVIKKDGKVRQRVTVDGTEEFESLFPMFGGYF